MQTLIVGLFVGTVAGAVATLVLVVDPLRRERELWRERIIREQMRTFAADARLQAHLWLRDAPGHNQGSLKVVK